MSRSTGPYGSGELKIVSLYDVAEADLACFYSEILTAAFSPEELVTWDELREAAANNPGPGVLVLDGETVVGGMLGEIYPRSGVLLLSYIAVRPDTRGRGIGRVLLTEVIPQWRAAVLPSIVLAEIEDPRFHEPSSYGDPGARLRLYQRTGAALLPMPFFQPSLRPGLSRVFDMLLICLDESGPTVPTPAVTAFLEEYFELCEGSAAVSADADFLALRRGACEAEADGRLPLWPLDRVPEIPRFRRASA
ncbi:GNAT family N-acetyltransferase [Frankia sp. Cppng1_Ct_nod]|uniref:GNAT family N-acetyltransferase n=1 Tax=Frankia sp. Cppng1_Ct_nod TaxID=2897162 RepID=UPI002023F07C|nr:GNAT family N-acetyltransferase [Frankia sp. Cppng1_Ct_nod]